VVHLQLGIVNSKMKGPLLSQVVVKNLMNLLLVSFHKQTKVKDKNAKRNFTLQIFIENIIFKIETTFQSHRISFWVIILKICAEKFAKIPASKCFKFFFF